MVNGNLQNERKGILNNSYTLTNTCAFGALVQMFTSAYVDKTSLESTNFDNFKNQEFIQFIKKFAKRGACSAIYIKRVELALNLFSYGTRQNMFNIDCATNIVTCYEKLSGGSSCITESYGCLATCNYEHQYNKLTCGLNKNILTTIGKLEEAILETLPENLNAASVERN